MTTGKPIKASARACSCFRMACMSIAHGNVWVTDGAISKDGSKGLQVTKLSPDGKVLMQLGIAGQRGDDETHFQSPSDVITAPNGDIFVTDGHAPIAPFIPGRSRHAGDEVHSKTASSSSNGARPGAGQASSTIPHALALDGKGRLFVADRGNNRIQIFSQDGKFIAEWKQFGRPVRLLHHRRPALCHRRRLHRGHPSGGWKKGVWIGSIAKAKADAFVPDDQAGEGVVVAPDGNMYGAVNVAPRGITRYLSKQSASKEKRS